MPASQTTLALVTGTSSGIGEALARELLRRGWAVLGISRRNAPLTVPGYRHLRLDLADLPAAGAALERTVRPLLAEAGLRRVGLVNNAALVALLGPVDRLDATALAEVYAVNSAAPVMLTGMVLRHAPAGIPIRVVNVSTGAAVTPLPGLGAYASSKAALRMLGQVLAEELEARQAAGETVPDATILSYEPGLVDTPMQAAVRGSSAEIVPIVRVFQDWAATGALVPAAAPAAEIADYLEADGHPRWAERRYQPPVAGG